MASSNTLNKASQAKRRWFVSGLRCFAKSQCLRLMKSISKFDITAARVRQKQRFAKFSGMRTLLTPNEKKKNQVRTLKAKRVARCSALMKCARPQPAYFCANNVSELLTSLRALCSLLVTGRSATRHRGWKLTGWFFERVGRA